MQIKPTRILEALDTLGHIGYKSGIGTSRVAYSAAFNEGRNFVKQYMEEVGLETYIDGVGNLTGRLCGPGSIIAIGSHIDTVPGGGKYDGVYGVLAGVEVLRTLKESGYQNKHAIEVIAFNEEEGNAVGGTFGSKAFAGQAQEGSAIEKLPKFNMTVDNINSSRRCPSDYHCYLEWHIEQGGVLEKLQKDVGIVEGIVGIARYNITVHGAANHAGTTPMDLRDDALKKACAVFLRAIEICRSVDKSMVCTAGYMNVFPGAVNVIPGKVEFPLEFRTLNMKNIELAVYQLQEEFAEISINNFLWQEATIMDEHLMGIISDCCKNRGLSVNNMPSGAGHDAINMALFTPTAMLFIPSVGGISHSPREFSKEADIIHGAELLLDTVVQIDKE